MKDPNAEWTWVLFSDPSRGDCIAQFYLDPEKLDAPPAIAPVRYLGTIQLAMVPDQKGGKMPAPMIKPVWIMDPALKPTPTTKTTIRFSMLIWWGIPAENIVIQAEILFLGKKPPAAKPVIATEADAKVESALAQQKRELEKQIIGG